MALKHEDVCTHIKNPADEDILTRKGFDVIVRLYNTNPLYKGVVDAACSLVLYGATTTHEGYKTPHGFSGANGGVPFNIIALADGTVLVNATYTPVGTAKALSDSNCGSLTLAKPIRIERWARVKIDGYQWLNAGPRAGGPTLKRLDAALVGYYPTHQHEIDHNNGILITDLEVK